jgi:hypothetical protein
MTRFLCIFLSAQSDDFQFNNAILCKALDCKDATLRKYMKEALNHGLIERSRKMVNGKFGYFDYTLIDPTTLQNLPHGKKTNTVKNQCGKSVRLNKEEYSNKEEKNNKEEGQAPAPASSGQRVEDNLSTPESSAPAFDADEAIEKAAAFTSPLSDTNLPKFEQGCPDVHASILSRVGADLKARGDWEVMVSRAYLKMTKDQFFGELKRWITQNQNSSAFFRRPTRSLRGGKSSFAGWLSNDFSRAKYGANKDNEAKREAKVVSRSPVRKTFTNLNEIA